MGKRSDFERNPRDFYVTPYEAVLPLLPHLPGDGLFSEPCAGNGALAEHLNNASNLTCNWKSDIDPQSVYMHRADALTLTVALKQSEMIITNPPWDRKILHPMIDHFRGLVPTWLLFDADWKHTKQAAPYLPYCKKIVSVGRVKWIAGSKHVGKDNCCWYLFGNEQTKTEFVGR